MESTSDLSHPPCYPALHQTSPEALFGIGALTPLWCMAFLDAQKMLKAPSRPGQLLGLFQPLTARVLGLQEETSSRGGSGADNLVQSWNWAVSSTAVPMGSLPSGGSSKEQLYSWPTMPLSLCSHLQCPVSSWCIRFSEQMDLIKWVVYHFLLSRQFFCWVVYPWSVPLCLELCSPGCAFVWLKIPLASGHGVTQHY